MQHRRLLSLAIATVVTALSCAARQPGAPLRPGFNMFSKQQDIQLGQEAAQQVRQQVQVVQNQFLQDYINTIGQRLAHLPEAGGYPYTFTLINDPSINAFSLPGGPTFVNTGLLAAADNEAQLAGVLAHEISHVALRHGTNQASKANLLQIPAALAGAVSGGGMLGQLAQLGIGLGANSVLLKFSRNDESEADALGSHLMSEAGWNPIEMARFFEKLKAEGGSRAPTFLSDHPDPGNREKAIEAEIRTLPQRSYGYETGMFQRAKSELGSVPRATSGRGLRSNAVNPSSSRPTGGMRQIQAQNFAFSYPDNWQAYGDNNSGAVTIAPREGLVQDQRGNVQVGYGVIASYFFPESQNENLQQATQDLIHHLHATNPGLQTSNNVRQMRVDGNPAYLTMLANSSPFNGAEEVDALLTVQRPEGVFYMIFIAPQSEFRNLQGVYNQMVQSIRFRG